MAFSNCTLVAASTRTSIGMLLREPRRTTSRSCSTRNNLTWIAIGKSPISSRNKVPPSASSNHPALALRAPVKAPFSWPNSSASTRDSENAPQLTATNGRLRRALRLWMCRATNSLPVPVSPMISTLASLGATCCKCASKAWDFGSSNTCAVARIDVARAGEGGRVSSCMAGSMKRRSGIESRNRQGLVQRPITQFMEFVIHRVVQGLRAQVAPVAVQSQRGVGRARAGHFEQAATEFQAIAGRSDLGRGNRCRQMPAFFGAEIRAFGPGLVEQFGGAFHQQSNPFESDPEFAVMAEYVGIFTHILGAGFMPGAGFGEGVLPRFFERPFGNAKEHVGERQLSNQWPQARERCAQRTRIEQQFRFLDPHPFERRAAAVGLALAHVVPVVVQGDTAATAGDRGDQQLAASAFIDRRGDQHL